MISGPWFQVSRMSRLKETTQNEVRNAKNIHLWSVPKLQVQNANMRRQLEDIVMERQVNEVAKTKRCATHDTGTMVVCSSLE